VTEPLYIPDAQLEQFARRKYGDDFAGRCAWYFSRPINGSATALRRSLTVEMRRVEYAAR
jgi:hypothetical protein